METGFALSEIDTTRPHPARMYDAYLGGKDNYPADREAVRQILRTFPEVRGMARANRAFMQRAVRFLAGEAGIRQFIDIGTGIPSAGNVHEVAGQAAPGARVVYVDNDPIVHVHANALLTGSGTTSIVLADLRDPKAILAHPKTARADRLHPARRLAAGRDLALHHGRGEPGRDRRHAARRAPGRKLSRPVARDGRLSPARHCRPGGLRVPERHRPARPPHATTGCRRSSTVSTWWSRGWCRRRCGVRTASRRVRKTW